MAKEITPKVGPNGKQGLTNHDLNQLWLRWAFTHLSSMSYEKLQAHAFAWSYIPFSNKYYGDDPEAKRRLLTRQSVFYNTEPQTGTLVNGIVASLEENIALGGEVSEDMPNNVKTALMGPLAGIGDSIVQGNIVPILFYIITWGIIGPAISFFCFRMGYKLGVGAVDMIVGEAARRLTDAFNVLGIMVIGALSAGNIALTTTLNIPMGGEFKPLQDTLDGCFPGILPLIAVLLTWWMLNKKQYSPTKVIIILCVVVSVLCVIGVF